MTYGVYLILVYKSLSNTKKLLIKQTLFADNVLREQIRFAAPASSEPLGVKVYDPRLGKKASSLAIKVGPTSRWILPARIKHTRSSGEHLGTLYGNKLHLTTGYLHPWVNLGISRQGKENRQPSLQENLTENKPPAFPPQQASP